MSVPQIAKSLLCTCAASFLLLSSVHAQLHNPAEPWHLGEVFFGVDLGGRTLLTFEGQTDTVYPNGFRSVDFTWSNASYTLNGNGLTLLSNGCHLARENYLDPSPDADTVLYNALYQPSDDLLNYCAPRAFAISDTRILPLGADTLAYVYELVDRVPGSSRVALGLGLAMLSRDSLLFADRGSAAVLDEPTSYLPGDTLFRISIAYYPRLAGGWWGVIKSSENNDRWRVLRISAGEGIVEHAVVNVGPVIDEFRNFATYGTFTPDGRTLAYAGADDGTHLYDFDPATGTLSYRAPAGLPENPERNLGYLVSAAFSASGRYLYTTDQTTVWQLDTQAEPLDSGWTRLDSPPRAGDYNAYYRMQRGPDCRIYIGPAGGASYLDVIDAPDEPGTAAGFYNRGLPTKYFYVSIPQHPEYPAWARARVARGLAPLIDTATCDATVEPFPYQDDPVSNIREVIQRGEVTTLKVWPSPVSVGGTVEVAWPDEEDPPTEDATLYLLDGQGRVIERVRWPRGQSRLTVSLPNHAAAGVYRVGVSTREGTHATLSAPRVAVGTVIVN